MLNLEQIAAGKLITKYDDPSNVVHEHPDCFRIAYEWLDAQVTIVGYSTRCRPLKTMIESWAGRYVSKANVEVAAQLHARISGRYLYDFNLDNRLISPCCSRLLSIPEALTQDYREKHNEADYTLKETITASRSYIVI